MPFRKLGAHGAPRWNKVSKFSKWRQVTARVMQHSLSTCRYKGGRWTPGIGELKGRVEKSSITVSCLYRPSGKSTEKTELPILNILAQHAQTEDLHFMFGFAAALKIVVPLWGQDDDQEGSSPSKRRWLLKKKNKTHMNRIGCPLFLSSVMA